MTAHKQNVLWIMDQTGLQGKHYHQQPGTLTFLLVIGELLIGHSQPAFLKVLLSYSLSALGPLMYLSVQNHTHT